MEEQGGGDGFAFDAGNRHGAVAGPEQVPLDFAEESPRLRRQSLTTPSLANQAVERLG